MWSLIVDRKGEGQTVESKIHIVTFLEAALWWHARSIQSSNDRDISHGDVPSFQIEL